MKIHFSQKTLIFSFCILIVAFGIFVRFQSLGYSNLQGDEILALLPESENAQGFVDEILSQRKGPIQFLFNFVFVSLFPSSEEAVLRFPYTLFAIVGIVLAAVLGRKIFSRNIGMLTAVLFSLCGLFISFARIVQYQSIMFFLTMVTALVAITAFRKQNIRWFLLMGIFSALLLLVHYDAAAMLTFIAALFVLEGIELIRKKKSIRPIGIRMLVYASIVLIGVSIFYLPFYFHSYFQSTTGDYLSGRLLGGGFMPRTAQSLKLLSLYMPREYWVGFFLFSLVGVFGAHHGAFRSYRAKKIFALFLSVLFLSTWFSLYPIKPRLSSLITLSASFGIVVLLFAYAKSDAKTIALTVWFLFAFSFYFFFVRDPRTHVYIAMIPGFFFIANGLVYVYQYLRSKHHFLGTGYVALIIFILLYLIGFNWMVYVDKKTEHPWWSKYYFGRQLASIQESKRIDGIFGFNSYRGWEHVSDLYKKGCLQGSYESNEKDVVTKYYLGFSQKEKDRWRHDNDADVLLVVEGPHSWVFENRREFPGYSLLNTITTPSGLPVTYIYGKSALYPNQRFLCENSLQQ